MKYSKKTMTVVANLVIVAMLCGLVAVTLVNDEVSFVQGNSFQPIYRGSSSKKQVTLMVNVYWGTEYLDEMLEIFDKHKVKTTFFVGGTWVNKNNEMLKKIDEKGHEIGNHGYFHKDHKSLSEKANREEIMFTNNLIKAIIGKDSNLFAPPSGSFSNITLDVVKKLNYKMIMWSKDTIDWRDKDCNLVYKRATKNLENGDLILMHPTAHTVKALDNILNYYEKLGFKTVTVTENIGTNIV